MMDRGARVFKTGNKEDVWVGRAMNTKGGLTKRDLMVNKRGKVVSKKQHAHGLSVGLANIKRHIKRPAGGGDSLWF